MSPVASIQYLHNAIERTRPADFIAPLLLRLYLAPIFWMAGSSKLNNMEATVDWFGDGLGIPLPLFMAWAAALTETLGAVLLIAGIAVRVIAVPLMVTMLVAALTVQWDNGWLAIAEGSGLFATERTQGAIERLAMARSILQEYGHYEWLTQKGRFVILNNGIEFAATYFIMLLTLFFTGAGRYLSIDYWLRRRLVERDHAD